MDARADRVADAAARRAAVRDEIASSDLDAAVLSSEGNFTYLTGHLTPSWAMASRPMAIVVTPSRSVAVVGVGEVDALREAAPDVEVVGYADPVDTDVGGLRLVDFAATVVAEVVAVLVADGARRVGVEASVPSAAGLPFDALRALAADAGVALVDAAGVMWRCRGRKSPWEVDRLAHVASALGDVYGRFAAQAVPGMTERELHQVLLGAAAQVGVDRVGFSIVIAGAEQGSDGFPGSRTWDPGELLLLDTCVVLDGYWADFCRHFAAEDVTARQAASYRSLVDALEAGRERCRAGLTAGALGETMAAALPDGGVGTGRLGHGIGLDMAEPPSLTAVDGTPLAEGMTITLEPAGQFACGHLEAEEMVVVAPDGCRLLSPPYPAELPVLSRT